MRYGFKMLLIGSIITTLLSGCGENEATVTTTSQGVQRDFVIEHIHGISYSADSLYVATHEGLFRSKDSGLTWAVAGNDDFDFMGFVGLPDGKLITSGHPGKKSKLPNPIGILESDNGGETWKAISLTGKVDFHILAPNMKNPNVIYGLNQMGTGKYGAGIYKSEDGGDTWNRKVPRGLPEDLHKVLSLLSFPDQANVLLAGTEEGVFKSEDEGASWQLMNGSLYITAMQILPNSDNEIIGYSITNSESGLAVSKDGGYHWETIGLDLGDDAVAYLSVNPNNIQQIAVTTYETSVYLTQDGGGNWQKIMEKGKLN